MKQYSLIVNGKRVMVKELNLGEWNSLARYKATSLALYDEVAKLCLVSPFYSDLLPGEVLAIGEACFILCSKFSDQEQLNQKIDEIKKNLENTVDIIPTIICEVFPAYTPEQIMSFDFDTLVTRLAQVSWIKESTQQQLETPPVSLQQRRKMSMDTSDLQRISMDKSKGALTEELRKGKGVK